MFLPLLLVLPMSAATAADICVIEPTGLIKEPSAPRGLEDIWERIHAIDAPSQIRLRRAFDAFSHGPFSSKDYRDLFGIIISSAVIDIRHAILAGIIEKGQEPSTYLFRKTVGPKQWQAFYEYGEVVHSGYLERAYPHVQGEDFRTQEFMETTDLTNRHKAMKILGEGVVTGVLHKKRRGLYKFMSPPPDTVPPPSYLLGESGIPIDVWHKAPLLGEVVLKHMVLVFQRTPQNSSFTARDYAAIAEITTKAAGYEIRDAVLTGIIQRAEGEAFLFRQTPGPTGLDAFLEYGPSAMDIVEGLAKAFEIFGMNPFNRKKLESKMDTKSQVHINRLLKEGFLTGILTKAPNHHYVFPEPFSPDRSLTDRPHGLSQNNYTLLEKAHAPWEVWDNASLLTDVVTGHLAHAFQELQYRPFDPEDYAKLMDFSAKMAGNEMREAFFAGLIQREENLYKFRESKSSTRWEILYEYGFYAEKLMAALENAFALFSNKPFSQEQFLTILPDSPSQKRDARRMLREARLAGILSMDPDGLYSFTSNPPDEKTKRVLRAKFPRVQIRKILNPGNRELPQEVLTSLKEVGIDPQIWRARGSLLGDSVLSRLTRALEAYRHTAFTVKDYAFLTNLSHRRDFAWSVRKELRQASLAGILRRKAATDSYVFRVIEGPKGWEAFNKYGPETRRNVHFLRRLFKIFGQNPIATKAIAERTGNPPKRFLDTALREAERTGIIQKGPRTTEYTFIVPPPTSKRRKTPSNKNQKNKNTQPNRKKQRIAPEENDIMMTEALDPQRVTQARRQYEERASSLFDQQRLPSESRDYLTGVSIHQSTRQIWENHEKEVYSLLDDHGVPRDVWSDITLIPSSSTVKGVITAFQRFRFEPFTIQDYQKLVGGSQRQADDDAMSAVLIGIVQQSERQGMLAFRKTKGPSGWDAFYQWDDDTLFPSLTANF